MEGPGLSALVAAVDPALDARIRSQLDASLAAVEAIPHPFDRTIQGPDDSAGRLRVLAAIEALEAQSASLVEAAARLGVTLNLAR